MFLFGVGWLQESPDVAGEIALEAADRFAGAFAFAAASGDGVAGRLVPAGWFATHGDVAAQVTHWLGARLPELRAHGGWISNGVSHRNLRSTPSVMHDTLLAVSGAAL